MSGTCVVVLVGIPAAGKTTFCKNFMLCLHNQQFTSVEFNYDLLLKDNTSEARKLIFEQVCDHLTNQTKHNHVVIIDDNMFYKSMRNEYFNFCKQLQIGFLQIYFELPLETALFRNTYRNVRIPEHIIKDMFDRIEVPKSHVKIINANETITANIMNECLEAIRTSLAHPLHPSEVVKRKPLPLSRMHYIELRLRKIVSKLVMDGASANKYNTVKQVLYKRIKSGDVPVEHVADDQLDEFLGAFFRF